MPAQNITLYAKWQAPVIEAKVYLTASADGEVRTINVEYGKKLSDSKDFKALLEKFKEEQPSAWIDSNGALFNVDTELYSSVTISPFFPSAKDGFTVTYVVCKRQLRPRTFAGKFRKLPCLGNGRQAHLPGR